MMATLNYISNTLVFNFIYYLSFGVFICVLAVPQSNSWQLETTNQDSTSTVNTPMDCKGKICIYIICKNKHTINN